MLFRSDAPDSDEDWSPQSWVESGEASPDESFAEREHQAFVSARLQAGLDTFDERARDIIESRWLRDEKVPLRKLAEKYAVSQERIRQIESRCLQKLRKVFSEATR